MTYLSIGTSYIYDSWIDLGIVSFSLPTFLGMISGSSLAHALYGKQHMYVVSSVHDEVS